MGIGYLRGNVLSAVRNMPYKPKKNKTETDEAFSGAPGFLVANGGPMPSKGAQLRAAKAEIEQLRKAIESPTDPEEWGKYVPQELRDEYAATALLAAELHPGRALKRLGINEPTPELVERILGTPGVQKRLAELTGKFMANQEGILKALSRIGLHGESQDIQIKAIQSLTKMVPGLLEGEKDANKGRVNAANFFMLGGGQRAIPAGGGEILEPADPDEVIDADAFLVHDVGEASLVVDEE